MAGKVTIDMSGAPWRFTPSQWRAVQTALYAPGVSATLLAGGYGSGKSRTGAHIALALAAMNAGMPGIIVAPTWGIMERATLPTFLEACPPAIIAVNRSRDPKAPHLVLVNGTKIFLGSAEIPSSLEGTNLAWEWLDEPRYYRPKSWEVLVGRARLAGAKRIQKVLTSTPASGWLQEQFGSGGVPGHAIVHISTRENAVNLDAGFIATLERTYSKRLAKSLIEGQFGLSENAVYESFDLETIHGIEWSYHEGLWTAVCIDFGRRRPAVTFWQQPEVMTPLPGTAMGERRVALDDTWVCFDELHPENVTTPRLAELIVGRAKERKYKLNEAFVDPAGRATQSVTGLSDVDVMNDRLPCPVRWCGDEILRFIPNGIDLVDGRLLNTRDETRLFVARHLANGGPRGIVNGFKSYAYPAPRNNAPVSDHPVKDGVVDHVMDTTRYLAINLEQRNRDSPR